MLEGRRLDGFIHPNAYMFEIKQLKHGYGGAPAALAAFRAWRLELFRHLTGEFALSCVLLEQNGPGHRE
jgi:hypothetical protein